MPEYDEQTKVNLRGFFEKGFAQGDNWKPIHELNLPAKVKFRGHEKDIPTKYGTTNRYIFEDGEGQNYSMLCQGKIFLAAIEEYVPSGTVVNLYKNDKGYWQFDLD